MLPKNWDKFVSMSGGFTDVYIMSGVVDGVPDKKFEACLGTFSGGGGPRWMKKVPEFASYTTRDRAREVEKLKVQKALARVRKKIDALVAAEMRKLGYIKQEA